MLLCEAYLLGKFFEKEFGPVKDAIVILAQMENKIHSRGFGFVTFKEEKSVSLNKYAKGLVGV